MLAAYLGVIALGYLRAASIANALGSESGWGLAAPSAFLRSMGVTAWIGCVILIISCIRREFLWPLAFLLLFPTSIFAVFSLFFLLRP
jgi:hypothetical protein